MGVEYEVERVMKFHEVAASGQEGCSLLSCDESWSGRLGDCALEPPPKRQAVGV